ncbi:MAG: NFACT RNA binding domain-containing protein [Bacillota bacterium]|nr:NFACT RNA binding domain-containing protein [Bacillota bacterium]
MPFDGMAAYAATAELKRNLILGKIEKIYQPQPEQLLFNIHTKEGKRKLFISASASHSAVYLVEQSPENPAEPPTFCMVLRKHLSAGRITDIVQHQNDRIIEILIETVNELGFNVNKKLVIEIMGKHSNVMLVDMESNRILDSIKHISIDVNRARQILPGKAYEYPPAQEKIPFTQVTEEQLNNILLNEIQQARAIMQNIQGISPVLAETIAAADRPYVKLRNIIDTIDSGTAVPLVYTDGKGKPVDFHITDLTVYDSAYTRNEFDTLSQAAAFYFINRESSNTVKQKANDLLRLVDNHLGKLRLKTQRLSEDLHKAENSDKYRLYGELLTANLHLCKPGEKAVRVINYYDGSTLEIPLDPKFSASRNAQNYYKKYGKYKTAIKEKKLQLEETASEITYLESVIQFIDKATSVEEIEAIRRELISSGYIRYRKNSKRPSKANKPKPISYTLSTGRQVMAGRNNNENDWLTLKYASSNDIWFHTKDIPGSHVILFTDGKEPSEEELFETAAIAAYHSKGASSANVPVDYTKARYVKKPAGAKPGMVIFTHNRTLYVNPEIPTEAK